MKKLSLIFLILLLVACSNNDDSNNENEDNNVVTGNYKIEYKTQLSDSDLDMDITFSWDDENDQLQSETINVLNPEAYSELTDERTALVRDVIGVYFIINSGSNYLSNTHVEVTNLDNNTSFDIMLPEPIGALNGAFDNNTLVVAFYTDNNDFEFTYGVTN
ncbi:hypothetical protein [Winogradskyella sp.]|uniref:hypothetical protein n=1 Tax=Winogradskyella sp. TaxID=1883156 RepID=UPI002633E5B2|nr:hypothetical protein [Winogradskyella sp.]